MHELSASQCRQQLQGLVFDLWTHLDTTRGKLTGKRSVGNPPVYLREVVCVHEYRVQQAAGGGQAEGMSSDVC